MTEDRSASDAAAINIGAIGHSSVAQAYKGAPENPDRQEFWDVSEISCVKGRVKKSVHGIGESFAEQNGKLIGRLFPRNRRHLPIFFDIAQGKEQQLAGGLVAREVTAILDDLA